MYQNGAEGRLIEAGNLPVVYVDGIATVELNGETARVTYFEYRMVAGERVRNPVLEIIWPANALGTGRMKQLMREARANGGPVLVICEGETAH